MDPLHVTTPTPTVDPYGIFEYFSPVNLILAVYIIFQNSVIIHDDSKDWKKLSSLLFILIATVDIGSACFEIARASVALLCSKGTGNLTMPSWILLTYLSLGLLCYTISTFFGMVLTVVKTINIMNPFFRINRPALQTCLTIFISLGSIFCLTDVLFFDTASYSVLDAEVCVYAPMIAFFDFRFVGYHTMFEIVKPSLKVKWSMPLYRVIYFALLFLEFGLPSLIVLCCMILQIIYIKRALNESTDPRENTANRATITIFLISLLYLLSISIYTVCLIREMHLDEYHIIDIIAYLGNTKMVAKYTLPLLNAAFFPTVLILRKIELRVRYWGYMKTVLLLPVSVLQNICSRRRGYTEL